MLRACRFSLAIALAFAVTGCGSDVHSADDARKAYLGIDAAIDKAIALGFDGFNAANSANIPAQMANGAKTGTLTVSGKVDQGTSDNKTMTLDLAFAQYSDDALITYTSSATAVPVLSMKLAKVPTGTLTGTLTGDVTMTGEVEGALTLNLAITADLQANATDATKVERKPGTTHVTGSATSKYGTYTVDVTR